MKPDFPELIGMITVLFVILSLGAFVLIQEHFKLELKNPKITFVGDVIENVRGMNMLKQLQKENPDYYVFLGDLGYTQPSEWFRMTENLERDKIKITLGNHDLRQKEKYLEYYSMKDFHYSFDVKRVHFTVISTETHSQEQFDFVLNSLEQGMKSNWNVVLLHINFYPEISFKSKNMEFRNMYQPYFDFYEVDAVISGHLHDYVISEPMIFNGTISEKGQYYIVVGTGGKVNNTGYLALTSKNDVLEFSYKNQSGMIIDEFIITK